MPASRSHSPPTAAGTAPAAAPPARASSAGRLCIGTKRSNLVPVLTLSMSSTVKCSASARTSDCPGLGIEDLAGQLQQFLGRGRGRARRGAGGEADRLAGIDVQHEEGLGRLDGPLPGILTVGSHVPLAEAAHAMGIDGQQPALEMARGAADLAQGDLEVEALGDGASPEQLVDGHVAGEERQAVGQLEDPLVQVCGGAAARCGTAPPRGSVATPGAAPRPRGFVPSSRTPGPRPPGGAIRGRAARCRPGFP